MVEEIQPAFEQLKTRFLTQKTKTYQWRIAQLKKVCEGLIEMEAEICEAMRLDLGRDILLNWVGEVAFLVAGATHDIRHCKEWMTDKQEDVELILAPAAVFTHYEPLGVVGIIGSWNAPWVTTVKPLINAITAGNCCIVKPSEISAHSAVVIKKFCDTYLDQDSIKCFVGGVDTAVAINKLPLDLMCFTGSTQVGRIIAMEAAKNLTPCILELGGKCPLVIDFDAAMDFTAGKVAFGKTINSGQICIAPDYVFVHESRVKEFIETIQLKFKLMYGEKPEGSEYQGKMVSDLHFNRVENLLKTCGGTVICGGKSNKEVRHIEPTVILQPDLESKLMTEEIFGPVLPVFPFKDIREVVKHINARDKPLAVYYFGTAAGLNSRTLSNQTSSGAYVTNEVIVHINSHTMGFGGVGASGQGRHGGFEGFKAFSNRKGVLLKGPAPAFVARLLVPPYGERMEKFLRGWFVWLNTTTQAWVTFRLKIAAVLFVVWIYLAFFWKR